MALSPEEQRVLDQLSATLAAEDPKLAHTLGSAKPRRAPAGRKVLSVIGILCGIALLVVGVNATMVWVSVIGFLLMFGSVALLLLAKSAPAPSAEFIAQNHPSSSGFMDRMEDRWNRRQEGN
jgi:Flp pilus assembly protein TadB